MSCVPFIYELLYTGNGLTDRTILGVEGFVNLHLLTRSINDNFHLPSNNFPFIILIFRSFSSPVSFVSFCWGYPAWSSTFPLIGSSNSSLQPLLEGKFPSTLSRCGHPAFCIFSLRFAGAAKENCSLSHRLDNLCNK